MGTERPNGNAETMPRRPLQRTGPDFADPEGKEDESLMAAAAAAAGAAASKSVSEDEASCCSAALSVHRLVLWKERGKETKKKKLEEVSYIRSLTHSLERWNR